MQPVFMDYIIDGGMVQDCLLVVVLPVFILLIINGLTMT
jgi:hypothetical protein